MYIRLSLWDIPQNRISIILHNIVAISPRLTPSCTSSKIIVTGFAHQEEIDEILDFLKDYHPGGRKLEKSNQPL